MSNGVRQGLGWALLGLVVWGVAAVASLAVEDTDSPVLDAVVGLAGLVGVIVGLVGLALAAWRLIRS